MLGDTNMTNKELEIVLNKYKKLIYTGFGMIRNSESRCKPPGGIIDDNK